MKKIIAIIILLFVVLGVFYIFSGCQDYKGYPDTGNFTIYLINKSDQDTHMWIGSEKGIDPSNKLAPNECRMAGIYGTWTDESSTISIWVYAGRDGKTIQATENKFTRDMWKGGCEIFNVKYVPLAPLKIKYQCSRD